MNLDTIAAALAARYAPTAVTPPASYKNITESTAQPPPNISNTPLVIVWPQSGTVTYASGGQKNHELNFLVQFFYGKAEGDERAAVAMQKWVGVLLTQTDAQQQLGTTGVMKAIPTTWEIDTQTYGGDVYNVINIPVRVDVREAVTLVP